MAEVLRIIEGPNSKRLDEIDDLFDELRDEQADEYLLAAAEWALKRIDMRKPNWSGNEERREALRAARKAVTDLVKLFPRPNYER